MRAHLSPSPLTKAKASCFCCCATLCACVLAGAASLSLASGRNSDLAAYNHPNIVHTQGFVACSSSASTLQLVLEGGQVSSLQSPTQHSLCFSQPESLQTLLVFAVDMLRALDHLADNSVVHRYQNCLACHAVTFLRHTWLFLSRLCAVVMVLPVCARAWVCPRTSGCMFVVCLVRGISPGTILVFDTGARWLFKLAGAGVSVLHSQGAGQQFSGNFRCGCWLSFSCISCLQLLLQISCFTLNLTCTCGVFSSVNYLVVGYDVLHAPCVHM